MSREAELIRSVDELIRPLLDDMDIEIVDIEWVREPHGRILRFLVDKAEGIDLDTVSKANEVIGHALDRTGLIAERYSLEVSSPGVERPLKKPEHFVRFTGSKISVRANHPIDGQRNFKGVLESAGESGISLQLEGSENRIDLDYGSIGKANLVFEFAMPKKPGKSSVSKRRSK